MQILISTNVMERFRTDFEATHYDWLVNQLAQKQATVTKSFKTAKAAELDVRRRIRKKDRLYRKARDAAREVAVVREAIERFQANQAEEPKVNVGDFEEKSTEGPLRGHAILRHNIILGPATQNQQ